jgi:protein-tyrosine phosphatase
VIDLHSHVLPGLDDGPPDLDGALAICQAAADEGIEVLAATPHVRDDYPTTPAQMEETLELLRSAAGGLVRLVPGGEVAVPELMRPVEELRRFGLAGNPGYLLVETPYSLWPPNFAEHVARLRAERITAVIAHPERNSAVQNKPRLVEEVVEAGALIQLTAGSLDGRAGWDAQACAFKLLSQWTAHLIASDAHAQGVRAIGMRSAVALLEDDELGRWLTDDLPRAIVDGGELPERPGRRRTRRWRFF